MINDSQAMKAAKELKEYCFERPDCSECIFHTNYCKIDTFPARFHLDGIDIEE